MGPRSHTVKFQVIHCNHDCESKAGRHDVSALFYSPKVTVWYSWGSERSAPRNITDACMGKTYDMET